MIQATAKGPEFECPFWITGEQMARLQPYFPKRHGRRRVDDRRVLGGIIFVNHSGRRWRDTPREYGPVKTLNNRWKRWSDKGIFIRVMEGILFAVVLAAITIFWPRSIGLEPESERSGMGYRLLRVRSR